MKKKKVMWITILCIGLAVTVWMDIPYIFTSTNIIAKNNFEYAYVEAWSYDFDKVGENLHIRNDDTGKVDELVSIIDGLSVRKVRRPKDYSEYGINFAASYKKSERVTYTEEVFSIRVYENNIIGFHKSPNYREKYYKILDKNFDMKAVLEELKEK